MRNSICSWSTFRGGLAGPPQRSPSRARELWLRGLGGTVALPVEGSHVLCRKAISCETLPVCEAFPGSRKPEPLRVSSREAACRSFFWVFWEAFSWLRGFFKKSVDISL